MIRHPAEHWSEPVTARSPWVPDSTVGYHGEALLAIWLGGNDRVLAPVGSNEEPVGHSETNPDDRTGFRVVPAALACRPGRLADAGSRGVWLAFLVWSSWNSRRALRNCLVVSLAAHLALVVFGSAFPGIMWGLSPNRRQPNERSHIREIRVATLVDPASRGRLASIASGGSAKRTSDDLGTARAAVGPGWRAAGPR